VASRAEEKHDADLLIGLRGELDAGLTRETKQGEILYKCLGYSIDSTCPYMLWLLVLDALVTMLR
jgi:hypothetical protein